MTALYALLMSIIFSLFPNQDVDCIEWDDYTISQCSDIPLDEAEQYLYEEEEIEIPSYYYWEFPYNEIGG